MANEPARARVEQHEDRFVLASNMAELVLCPRTGHLLQLTNTRTGARYIDTPGHTIWSLQLDPDTADLWQARSRITINGHDHIPASIDVEQSDTEATVRFTYRNLGGHDGLDLTWQVAIRAGEDVFTWNLSLSSNATDLTVTAIDFPIIAGVENMKDERLLWPWHEGLIIDNPGDEPRRMSYPLPASMQWMALFNQTDGVALSVLDHHAHHKELRFGARPSEPHHEPHPPEPRRNASRSADPTSSPPPRTMVIRHWPFCPTGSTWTAPPAELHLYTGGWYAPADRYRHWLHEVGWTKPRPPIAQDFNGFGVAFNQFGGGPVMPYDRLPEIARRYNEFGLNIIEIKGWHEGGFDVYYPDYEYLDAAGGREGLQSAIRRIHADGNRILVYLNNRIADLESNWLARQTTSPHPRSSNDPPVTEIYYHRPFHALCPAAPEWRKRMVELAVRLRTDGVDGFFFDQMMEMPSSLCFDPNHGHTTPATAFSEGYQWMMKEIHHRFADIGSDDYLFVAEGVSDYYSQWIDVCGMMWARRLGSRPDHAWEVTRYTLPAIILGIGSADIPAGKPGEYGRAFLAAKPFVIGSLRADPHDLPRYLQIYDRAPEIYRQGRYLHRRGLEIADPHLDGSVITAETGDSFAIQLFNPTSEPSQTEVTVTLSELGISRQVVKDVEDLEAQHLTWTQHEDKLRLTLTVPPRGIRAVQVLLSD